MSAVAALRALLHRARVRRAAIAFALVLPVGLALIVVFWRLLSLSATGLLVAVLLALLGSAYAARRSFAAIDAAWLNRQLNQRHPDFEDSIDLLWAPPGTLAGLSRLQQQRLAVRIDNVLLPDLRAAWPWQRLSAIWIASTVVALLALAAPVIMQAERADVADARPTAAEPRPILSVLEMQLDVVPPAYTGLTEFTAPGPEATVPEGATLLWRIALDGQPDSARLAFHDGTDIPLVLQDGLWQGERQIDTALLYRLHTEGGPPLDPADTGLHRIEIIPDLPPVLRVFAPDRTLSLVETDQRDWTLEFEASDDYGLAKAQLSITLAHGTGENVIFRETTRTLHGEGSATRKRYRHRIDLAQTGFEPGFEPGDDLILRLSVIDNREPLANTTRHPSLILRWPLAQSGEVGTLEGVLRDVLPAYFRSQRQIIIDTEALLAERAVLDQEIVVERSDAIGVDQRILRLRYGQFLGEDAELAAPPPAADEDAESAHAGHGDHDGHDHGHDHGHNHGENEPTRSAVFGEIGDVIAEYGHIHDYAEAATLFDNQTKELLRAALNAMWQAELYLRTGRPDGALPHEYRALDFIKQVQQANRIYLARVGLELPPIDFDRRLGGDLEDVAIGSDPLTGREDSLDWLFVLWTALEQGEPADLNALESWLAQTPAPAVDPLELLAAADRLRRDPDCRDCANALARLIWPLLPRPPAQVPTRPQPDAVGQQYLDAIQAESNRRGGRP